MVESSYIIDAEEVMEHDVATAPADKAVIGFIVFAASLCVALIAGYVVLFDGKAL